MLFSLNSLIFNISLYTFRALSPSARLHSSFPFTAIFKPWAFDRSNAVNAQFSLPSLVISLFFLPREAAQLIPPPERPLEPCSSPRAVLVAVCAGPLVLVPPSEQILSCVMCVFQSMFSSHSFLVVAFPSLYVVLFTYNVHVLLKATRNLCFHASTELCNVFVYVTPLWLVHC